MDFQNLKKKIFDKQQNLDFDNMKIIQIRNKAQQGNMLHQYYLGKCHDIIFPTRKGIKKNFGMANKWYLLSAEQGFTDAIYQLCCLNMRFKKYPEQTIKFAEYLLLDCQENRDGIDYPFSKVLDWLFLIHTSVKQITGPQRIFPQFPVNDKKAIKYLQIGIEKYSIPQSSTFLGDYYFFGVFFQQNYGKALENYLNAANLNEPRAKLMLSRIYLFGFGINANYVLSKQYVNEAKKQLFQKKKDGTLTNNELPLLKMQKDICLEIKRTEKHDKDLLKREQVSVNSCATCGRKDKKKYKLLRCSRCKKITYCSVECQKNDWKKHKKKCKKERKEVIVNFNGISQLKDSYDKKRKVCFFCEGKNGSARKLNYSMFVLVGIKLKINWEDQRFVKGRLSSKNRQINIPLQVKYHHWSKFRICGRCNLDCTNGLLVGEIMFRTTPHQGRMVTLQRTFPRIFHYECMKKIVPNYPWDSVMQKNSLYTCWDYIEKDMLEIQHILAYLNQRR